MVTKDSEGKHGRTPGRLVGTLQHKILAANVIHHYHMYSVKLWWGKTLANQLFQGFGEENVGEFTIANISYFSESGIWLGKILANDVRFAKFATKVFPCQNFALYGILPSQSPNF